MCRCQASGHSPLRFRLQMPRRPLCRSSRYSRCHLPEPGVPRWLPGTPRRVLLILSRPGRQLLPLPSRRKSGFCILQELRSPRREALPRILSLSQLSRILSPLQPQSCSQYSDSYFPHPVAITAAAATQIPAFIIFFMFSLPSILSLCPCALPIFRVTRA